MKPHGGQRKFQLVTTVADTTTVLDSSYSSDIIIGGTAVMQVYDLGDATKYRPGRAHFIFYNNTPEFVGIKNSDNSVWHRVPPRARCICALESNAAAAGVWWSAVLDPATQDPRYGLSIFDDAIGSISTTAGSFFGGTYAGTGAILTNGYNNCNSEEGKQGTYIGRTGTTATGYVYARSPMGGAAAVNIRIGGGSRAFEILMSLEALSVVAEEYISRQGWINNAVGGAPTRALYLVYDRLTWGNVWVMRAINAAGNTSVPTAIAPTIDAVGGSNWQRLRGEISSAGTRGDFWIDDVKVSGAGGITTNLPAVTDSLYQQHGLTKSAGLSQRHIFIDYLRMQSYPTVLR